MATDSPKLTQHAASHLPATLRHRSARAALWPQNTFGLLRYIRLAVVAWFLLVGALGCGPPKPQFDPPDPTQQNLRRIGRAYGDATVKLTRPPANLEELLPYLEKYAKGKANEILQSPNDKQDFEIVWNVNLRESPEKGEFAPVIAYEKVGKDGQRNVLRGRSDIVVLTPEQLKAAVFPPDYKPSF